MAAACRVVNGRAAPLPLRFTAKLEHQSDAHDLVQPDDEVAAM